MTWSTARVNHIRSSNCSVNSTFELETHTTVASGHFLGSFYRFDSDLPSAYVDTGILDGNNTVAGVSTRQWTGGTSRLVNVSANRQYRQAIYTNPGAQGSGDPWMMNGALGVRIPAGCHSTWCIFQRDSYFSINPWKYPNGAYYTLTKSSY